MPVFFENYDTFDHWMRAALSFLETYNSLHVLNRKLLAQGLSSWNVHIAAFRGERTIKNFNISILVLWNEPVRRQFQPMRFRLPKPIQFGQSILVVVHSSDTFYGNFILFHLATILLPTFNCVKLCDKLTFKNGLSIKFRIFYRLSLR